jgi:hypothetical protein
MNSLESIFERPSISSALRTRMLPWLFSTSLASDKDGSVELAEVLKDFCRKTGNDRKGTAAGAWLPMNKGPADMERPTIAERGWGSNDVRANRNRCIFSAGAVGGRIQQISNHGIFLQAKPYVHQRGTAPSTCKLSRCNAAVASAHSANGNGTRGRRRRGQGGGSGELGWTPSGGVLIPNIGCDVFAVPVRRSLDTGFYKLNLLHSSHSLAMARGRADDSHWAVHEKLQSTQLESS